MVETRVKKERERLKDRKGAFYNLQLKMTSKLQVIKSGE
jgi:hypothetical protein